MHSRAIIALLVLSAIFATGAKYLVGGWSPIEDLDNPELIKATNFAIKSINADENTHYQLGKIRKAWSQIVAGVNYRIAMTLTQNHMSNTRTVVVWDQFGKYQLTSDEDGIVPPDMPNDSADETGFTLPRVRERLQGDVPQLF